MAFTGHGHQIPGTPVSGTQPAQRSRCGGPGLCAACRKDALRYKEYNDLFPPIKENLMHAAGMEPTEVARRLVVNKYNEEMDRDDSNPLDYDQTYYYMYTYILGGWKCYVSTTKPDDKIYEVTYNKEKGEVYVCSYVKISQSTINITM